MCCRELGRKKHKGFVETSQSIRLSDHKQKPNGTHVPDGSEVVAGWGWGVEIGCSERKGNFFMTLLAAPPDVAFPVSHYATRTQMHRCDYV